MKTMVEISDKKVPAVRIDPSLDKFDDVVLFPDKLSKSNEQLQPVKVSFRTSNNRISA